MDTPTPSPANTPPRPRRWGWLRSALLTLLVGSFMLVLTAIVGASVWFQTNHFQRLSTQAVLGLIQDQTGEKGSLARIELGLFPPRAGLVGLTLFNPTTGASTLSVERATAWISFASLWPQLGHVQLDRPELFLHLDNQGKLVEFQNVKKPPSSGGGGLKRLPWSSLGIHQGHVRVQFEQGAVTLSNLMVTPVRGTRSTITGTIQVAVRQFTDTATLALPDTDLGPDRIRIPALRLSSGALNLSASADIPFQGDINSQLVADIHLDPLTPLLEPPKALQGQLQIALQVSGPPSDPTVEAQVTGTSLGYNGPGRTALLHYSLPSLSAKVHGQRDRIAIDELRLGTGAGHVLASGQVIHAEPTEPDGTPRWQFEQGRLVAHDLSLASVLRATDAAPNPWVDMRINAEVDCSGPLTPLALNGTINARVDRVLVGDRPVDKAGVKPILAIPYAKARGQLTLVGNQLRFNVHRLTTPHSQGQASGRIDFPNGGALDLYATLTQANLLDFAPLGNIALRGEGLLKAHLWGPFKTMQLMGWGDLEGFSVLGLDFADTLTGPIVSPDFKSLELVGIEAVKGKTSYSGDFIMDFRPPLSIQTKVNVPDGRIEDLTAVALDLPGVTGKASGTLAFAGPINEFTGASHLQLADIELYGESFDSGKAHGYLNQGTFLLDDLSVERANGQEGFSLSGSIGRQNALNMWLVGSTTLAGSSWIQQAQTPVMGQLNAYIHLGNTYFEPWPNGQITLTNASYAGEPAQDSVVHLDTTDGELALTAQVFGSQAGVQGTYGLWTNGAYNLTADLEQLRADLLWPVAADGQPLTALVDGQLTLAGNGSDWKNTTALTLSLSEVLLKWDRHTLQNPQPWNVVWEPSRWTIEGVGLEGGNSLLEVSALHNTLGTHVTGSGQLDADLGRAVVPGLRRADGELTFELFTQGTGPKAALHAAVALDAPLVKHNSFPQTFEDLILRAEMSGNRFVISDFKAHLGGGDLLGTGGIPTDMSGQAGFAPLGIIQASNWMPTRFALQTTAQNVQVKWSDSLAPAIGNADLSLDGPTDALLLSGTVNVLEMTFVERIDWEQWILTLGQDLRLDAPVVGEEPILNFDIAINADETIKAVNNVAELVASAQLNVVGNDVRPGMLGWVRINDGVLFMQDRTFTTERGEVVFRDAWSWDPDLDINLRTNVNSRRQRYRIYYRIFGRFSNWQTATRSDPALAQADINTLLWFGATSDELEDRGATATAVSTAAIDLMIQNILLSDVAGFRSSAVKAVISSIDLNTGGVNLRGEYSSDVRLLVRNRIPKVGDLQIELNFNRDDHYARLDRRISRHLSISGWYATRQRSGISILTGGAVGVDLRANWDFD